MKPGATIGQVPDAGAYLQPKGELRPSNAAVAIIVDEYGRYLMQLRDARPDIFFPAHWGCFGGALDLEETHEAALNRELWEELRLDATRAKVARFTEFTFDFGFAGAGIIDRRYFVVGIEASVVERLSLGEGCEMRLFEGPDLLAQAMVPYDRFALWMHCYRQELRSARET